MGYRLFNLKIVPQDHPNDEGRWVQRVVPSEWPGDDKAGSHMIKTPPDYETQILPGYHAVKIEEVEPGPPDQPGSMREMAGFGAGVFDAPQPSGFGMGPR